MPIECLSHCQALCCRHHPSFNIIFDFSPEEVKLMQNHGANLRPYKNEGYILLSNCPFLVENRCSLHDQKIQPQCCVDNHPGENLCLSIRQHLLQPKRWNQVE